MYLLRLLSPVYLPSNFPSQKRIRFPFFKNSYLDSSIPCASMLQLYFSMAIAASKIKETRPKTNFLCVTPSRMKFPVE